MTICSISTNSTPTHSSNTSSSPASGEPFQNILAQAQEKSSSPATFSSAGQGNDPIEGRLPCLWGIKPKDGRCISLNDMETRAQEIETQFGKKFRSALARAGISADPSVDVSLRFDRNPSGEWDVKGDNPNKEEILKALDSTPGLRDLFSMVNSLREVIQAGQEALEFQNAYRQNPQEAVQRFSYLFVQNRPTPRFHFILNQEGHSYTFSNT